MKFELDLKTSIVKLIEEYGAEITIARSVSGRVGVNVNVEGRHRAVVLGGDFTLGRLENALEMLYKQVVRTEGTKNDK